ncbi:hypothetical protein J4429_04025 [Candidatus Pacearchaeota archaeon]|nr:hypothetical protein [Candidatus Pacearchaeota archaeon]
MKNRKNKISFFIIGLAIIFSATLISADDFCFLTLGDGEKIPITGTDFYTCTHTKCSVCATASIPHWYASWNKCAIACGEEPQNEKNLTLSANFPFSNGGVYTKQNFLMNILTNKISSIYLIDNIAGKQKSICPNCMSYKKSATFKQGFNDITIRAVKGAEIEEKRITFFIDNKKPRITKTFPLSKKYANGNFTVFYDEDNVKKIELNYGTLDNFQNNVLAECESGKSKSCSINIDLAVFENQAVSYWFKITDIADNEIESKHINIFVDRTAPVINNINYSITKTNVNFIIDLNENNFYKVFYSDNEKKLKILCSSLKNSICSKKINFKKEHHDVNIVVMDKAGNFVSSPISFDII